MKKLTLTAFYAAVALFAQSFFLQHVLAQEDDAAELVTIVHAIAKGWEKADGTPFRVGHSQYRGKGDRQKR